MKKQKPLGRGAGVLLPVSCLPSDYGIGTFGHEAYRFVDFLAAAGQRYWQVLPLGPTSYGDSPYLIRAFPLSQGIRTILTCSF